MTRVLSIASLLFLTATQLALAAGPRVDIVIGEKASALEKRAAEDIAFDLKKVYDANVKIATAAPEGAENVIFVGSLKTQDATMSIVAGPTGPGGMHVLKTAKFRGRPSLYIRGDTPRDAYWGASEFAHSLGIRSMLYGDLYPVAPKPFSLEGYDIVLDAYHRKDFDYWLESNPFPTGHTAWSLDDMKRLLRQRARLKQPELHLKLYAWEPFAHFEIDNTKKKTGVLWYGWQFPVNGDTAGRSAFHGTKLFENPDFVGKTSYDDRISAGKKWLNGLIAEAQSFGMTVEISVTPEEFPSEFSGLFPKKIGVSEPMQLAFTSLEERIDADKLTRHEQIQFDAYKQSFPLANRIYVQSAKPLNLSVYGHLVADLNLAAYQVSRNVFRESPLTAEASCRDFVAPVCGEGVDGSILKGNQQIVQASSIMKRNDGELRGYEIGRTPAPPVFEIKNSLFNMPAPDMVLKHYASTDPPPEWWSKVRDNYLGAMNDMYRANSRAREGGRSYTLYLARRCEFGYEYMNCVEATRKAGIAKSKKDTAEQRAQLEKAIESMNAACSALAAVARDQSDRGMIAVCNEFGYKALQKELEKLDGEEGK